MIKNIQNIIKLPIGTPKKSRTKKNKLFRYFKELKKTGLPLTRNKYFLIQGNQRVRAKVVSYKLRILGSVFRIITSNRRGKVISIAHNGFKWPLRRIRCNRLLCYSRRVAVLRRGLRSHFKTMHKIKNKSRLVKRMLQKGFILQPSVRSFFHLSSSKLLYKKNKKVKKPTRPFHRRKIWRDFDRSPFRNLEKFSFFKLFGYLKTKRHNYRHKGARKFRKRYKHYSRHTINFSKKNLNARRGGSGRAKKKHKNLVLKNKVWCVQIKKSDGRLIYRPLKLSDFLSSRSGWRTRSTSFRKRISKSGRPSLLIRFILRSRNEFDSLIFKKRKIYNYYKKIYKYIEWKFRHYRSLFKKHALSNYKYTTFQNMSNQFSWHVLSSRIIQAKASNLSDSFSNSTRYIILSNSPFLWQLSRSSLINGALPSSFYSQYYKERNVGGQFQSRPYIYNWNKKYRVVYNKNTHLWHQFQKPLSVCTTPALAFKSSPIFSWYNSRFANLMSNRQRHFVK